MAESQNRWPCAAFRRARGQRPRVAAASGGVLLQDVHVAALRVAPLVRAGDSPRRGLGRAPTAPDPDRYAQRYAHCDVLVVGAGPAGLAPRCAAAAAGARVMLCDEQAELGGSLLDDPRGNRSTGDPAQQWLAESLADLAAAPERHGAGAHDGIRLFPAQHARAVRAGHAITWRCPRRLAARTAVAGARPRSRARDRLDRAATGISGQRSAGRHAGVRGADLPASLRRGRRRASRARHRLRRGVCCCARSACGGQSRCADRRRPRTTRPARRSTRRVPRASKSLPARTVFRTSGRLGVHTRGDRQRRRMARSMRQRNVACDALLMSGGYTPERAPVLAVARQGGLGRRASRRSCRSARRNASARPARAGASTGSATCSTTARRRGSRATRALEPQLVRSMHVLAVTREFSTLGKPGALLQPGLRHARRVHSSISRTT